MPPPCEALVAHPRVLAIAVLALCAVGALLYVQRSSEILSASTSSAVIARHAITHAVPLRDEVRARPSASDWRIALTRRAA